MLTPDYTGRFKKDYKLAVKRNYNISLIDAIIRNLINEHPLDARHKDHALSGEYEGCSECHINQTGC